MSWHEYNIYSKTYTEGSDPFLYDLSLREGDILMKRRFFLLFFMTVLNGCFYSPWESLEYEAVGSPNTHAQAAVALAGGIPEPQYMSEVYSMPKDRYATFKIEEVMYSIMLLPTGYYQEERGPYTLWLFAAELKKKMNIGQSSIVNVRSIVVKTSDNIELWWHGNFILKLDKCRKVNSRDLAYGESKMLLPDVLNPKDGKNINIDITVKNSEGHENTLGFCFRPKVSSGKFQTIN